MKYSDFLKLLETKDRFIDSNSNLTQDQKNEIKNFFNKHPNYENKIDWNKYRHLTYDDFKSVLELENKSVSAVKKGAGISGLKEGEDYIELDSGVFNGFKYHAYQPLTYYASRLIASDKVEPKVSAKWCTAWQKSREYWDKHSMDSGEVFIYLCGEGIPTKKVAISASPNEHDSDSNSYSYSESGLNYNIWDAEDDKYSVVPADLPFNAVVSIFDAWKNISLVRKLHEEDVAKTNAIRKKEIIKSIKFNEITKRYDIHADGAIVDANYLTLLDLWDNGYIKKPLGKINGDFILKGSGLKSFENGPIEVTGEVDISDNPISSLEGAPRRVGADFIAEGCVNLTTLKGITPEVGGMIIVGGCSLESLDCSDASCEVFQASGNKLTSLIGCPKVEFIIYVANNELKNLIGIPKGFHGELWVNANPLRSLEGCPRGLERLSCRDNLLTSLDYAPEDAEIVDFRGSMYLEEPEYQEYIISHPKVKKVYY